MGYLALAVQTCWFESPSDFGKGWGSFGYWWDEREWVHWFVMPLVFRQLLHLNWDVRPLTQPDRPVLPRPFRWQYFD